jgi:hypothetical protein
MYRPLTEVSGMDRRSVKAGLAGRGDFRALWWNVVSAAYQLFSRRRTLEHAMFDFHRGHHAVTLFGLNARMDFRRLSSSIRKHGTVKVVKDYVAQLRMELKKEVGVCQRSCRVISSRLL